MKFPASVEALGGKVTVRRVPEVSRTDAILGMAELHKRILYVEDASPPYPAATQIATFYHELMHFALWDSGHHHEFNESQREVICNVVGAMMARLDRRP